jgi:hypothetical protein
MSLVISTFIPEGIVISSDSRSIFRTFGDDGFTDDSFEKFFSILDKYILVFLQDPFIDGKCIKYHLNAFLAGKDFSKKTTIEVVKSISNHLFPLLNKTEDFQRITLYFAGYDLDSEKGFIPSLYLADSVNNSINLVNRDLNGNVVFNYHSIGESKWISRMFTKARIYSTETEFEELEDVQIDFSKYSLKDAVNFSKSLIEYTIALNKFSQIRSQTGGTVSTLALTPLDGIMLF